MECIWLVRKQVTVARPIPLQAILRRLQRGTVDTVAGNDVIDVAHIAIIDKKEGWPLPLFFFSNILFSYTTFFKNS